MSNPYTGNLDAHVEALGEDTRKMRCPRGQFAKAMVDARGDVDVAAMSLAGIVDVDGVADEYRAADVMLRAYEPIAAALAAQSTVDVYVQLRDAAARVKQVGRAMKGEARAEVERLKGLQRHHELRTTFVKAVGDARSMISGSVWMLDAHIHAMRSVAAASHALSNRAYWLVQGSDCSTYWESEPESKRPPRASRFVSLYVEGRKLAITGPGATPDVDLDELARSVAIVCGLDVVRTWLALNESTMTATINIGVRRD